MDGKANLSQLVREMDGCNLPQTLAEIPWGHNTELLFKLKDPLQRLWYAREAQHSSLGHESQATNQGLPPIPESL